MVVLCLMSAHQALGVNERGGPTSFSHADVSAMRSLYYIVGYLKG